MVSSHQWNEERLKSDVAAISNDNTGDNEDNFGRLERRQRRAIADRGAERPDNLTETMIAGVSREGMTYQCRIWWVRLPLIRL